MKRVIFKNRQTPIVIFEAKAWNCTAMEEKRIGVAEMKFLGVMLGETRRDREKNM